MKKLTLQCLSGVTAFLLISSCAFAQYIWLNEKGVKQFSDKPPPTSVPRNKILKAPHVAGVKTSEISDEEKANTSENDKTSEIEKLKKPQTIANKNEEFNKLKQEREEQEKKAQDEQKRLADNKKQCERAKSYQRSLENGVLVASTSANGERVILDANQRAKELADAKKFTAECK